MWPLTHVAPSGEIKATSLLLQTGLYVPPMQYDVYHNHDDKKQRCPFVDLDQEMSQRNQESFSLAVPPGQNKPVDQTGRAQETEKNKRYHIDYPEFQGSTIGHLCSSFEKYGRRM